MADNYQEKQDAKRERFEALATKNKQKGESLLNSADGIARMIPMGQPILVGHHSEKRHRRDLDRIRNRTSKGFEALEKSKHYERKIHNIDHNTSISSDDPEAVDKLEIKLVKLEERREEYKDHNKKARKEKTDQLPRYMLTNLGANIRTVKKRIEILKQRAEMITTEKEINGIKIVNNTEENRLQMFFDGKPRDEIRIKLKSYGFKWSRFNGCWQRHLSSQAAWMADEIAQVV